MNRWSIRISAALIGAAAMIGAVPVPALANTGKEADCICEVKCTEDEINDLCPVCKEDYKLCQGEEPAEEPEEEKELEKEMEKEEPEPEPAEEPEEPEEPQGPLTPDGNMTLVDDYGDPEKSGKQFITMTSKNGNYFYLIIDRDDNGNETVHFLNLVDEADILSLMDEKDVEEYATKKSQKEEPEPEVKEEKPEPEPETAPEPEKEKKSVPAGSLALLVLAGLGGIGFYAYKKYGKITKKDDRPDPDADYNEAEEGEDYLDTLAGDDNSEEINPQSDED